MRLQSVNALFKFRWRSVEISGTEHKYIHTGLNISKTHIFLTLVAHHFAKNAQQIKKDTADFNYFFLRLNWFQITKDSPSE